MRCLTRKRAGGQTVSPSVRQPVSPSAGLASAAAILILLTVAATSARAQVPIPIPQMPVPTSGDTVQVPAFRVDPPISPIGALWRSMLVPGWGQATLGRRVTGAAFVFWEGVTATMTIKAMHQRAYMERTGSNNVDAKRQEVQDWAVLWGFNHLISGAEAFVAAMLWDFPVELESRVEPNGDMLVGLRYYIN